MTSSNSLFEDGDIIIQQSPSTKVIDYWNYIIVAFISTLFLVILIIDPTEYVTNGDMLVIALVIIGLIFLVRNLLKRYVLKRTKYIVTDKSIRKEFELLYQSKNRVMRKSDLRGIDITRSRFETLLGIGSIEFLTSGDSRNTGFIRFEHIKNPEEVYEILNV